MSIFQFGPDSYTFAPTTLAKKPFDLGFTSTSNLYSRKFAGLAEADEDLQNRKQDQKI
jgi:hypothetical protein